MKKVKKFKEKDIDGYKQDVKGHKKHSLKRVKRFHPEDYKKWKKSDLRDALYEEE
jgi:hypothetical protein